MAGARLLLVARLASLNGWQRQCHCHLCGARLQPRDRRPEGLRHYMDVQSALVAHQPGFADLYADDAHIRAPGYVQRRLPDTIDPEIDAFEPCRRNGDW